MAGSLNRAQLIGNLGRDPDMDASKICRCGNSFGRPPGLSATQWRGRRFCSKQCSGKRRSETDAEIVLFYDGGLSSTQIGALIGISQVQVCRVIVRAGKIRDASTRLRLSHSRESVRKKLSEANLGKNCPESVKQILRSRVGPKNSNWRGGITLSAAGYLQYTNSPENGDRAGRGVHSVVLEQKIGRPLTTEEVAHHTDHIKLNNDPSNLEAMSRVEHARYHALVNGLGTSKWR